ncbi:tRNA isopentenyltransferase [Auriculariales sp. MPI-PUGE-AT-0066]|nr:tRNA isopentenyltransferase [Auriculariales sp. MPI-PUGE-AT-0066]
MGQLHSDWAGADVINADSMQVYSGLDIITNKVTQDEMRAVPHHLLGHKDVLEANYMVHDWIKDALPVINRAHTQNRVPFVVGGTAYWIQHLIFPDRLAATDPQVGSSVPALSSVLSAGLASLSAEQRDLYDNVSDIITDSVSEDRALELHNLLLCLDPVTGARWHWRDTRKVVRSLEVMKENGCLASELYAAQSEASLATRYRTLLFWLNASPEVLNPRLDARVEQMVKLGLLDEIQTMRELAETLPQPVDHSCGIFQSIGYKEFSEYLDDPMRPQPLFDASLAKMRVSTAKYAQRQVKWILNKLLPACAAARDRIDLVVLDAGTADWDAEVLPHAMRALKIPKSGACRRH